jgi:sugar-phosphatase
MQYCIQAVIFDLDGVIINSNPAIEQFWKNLAEKYDIPLTNSLIRRWVHGRKIGDTLSGLFGHLSANQLEEIRESAYLFDQDMQPGPITGIVSFVQTLQQLKIPTGIVTSSHHSRMLKMISQLGIEERFDHFVTAHDVSKGKPDPEPYLAMSLKMNLPPEQCLVFEDAVSGIQSATAAGMHAIGIGEEDARTDLTFHGAKDVIEHYSAIRIHQRTFTTPNGISFSIT